MNKSYELIILMWIFIHFHPLFVDVNEKKIEGLGFFRNFEQEDFFFFTIIEFYCFFRFTRTVTLRYSKQIELTTDFSAERH